MAFAKSTTGNALKQKLDWLVITSGDEFELENDP